MACSPRGIQSSGGVEPLPCELGHRSPTWTSPKALVDELLSSLVNILFMDLTEACQLYKRPHSARIVRASAHQFRHKAKSALFTTIFDLHSSGNPVRRHVNRDIDHDFANDKPANYHEDSCIT